MVELLKSKIEVAQSLSSSLQARVFFGREPNLGIKVVVKQYRNDLRGFFREIRIFTELERTRKNSARKELQEECGQERGHQEL